MSTLSDRLLAVHVSLTDAGLPHAFGGAIALAYCTQEPRGTRDLDVNVFVGPEMADQVLDSLPRGVAVGQIERDAARRDAQVRVMWDETPIDVFLAAHEFHHEVAQEIQDVPFEKTTIPVLGCEALVIFKAIPNRTRDWADIETMLSASAVDCGRALDRLRLLLGPTDRAVVRLASLCEA